MEDVLNSESVERFNKIIGEEFDFGKLAYYKIFHINSKDTVSYSRSGKKIYVPTFWSVLNVKLPAKSNLAKIKHLLEKSEYIIYIDLVAPIEYHNASDSLYNLQQSLYASDITSQYINNISADSAWTIETGKPWIKVGMSDSGFDTTHIDLDFVNGGLYWADPITNLVWHEDLKNHGTKVAGIIGAKRNNFNGGVFADGIAGIAGGDYSTNQKGVSLYGLSLTMEPQLHMGAASIVEAAYSSGANTNLLDDPNQDHFFDYNIPGIGFGLHILNCSWGGRVTVKQDSLKYPDGDYPVFGPPDAKCDLCYEAMEFAYRNELVVVASRGNSSSLLDTTVNFPATFSIEEAVISVGGSGTDGERINFTVNGSSLEPFGSTKIDKNIDVIAPATDSMVTATGSSNLFPYTQNDYRGFNASSAAAPHVPGIAALLLSQYNVPNCYSRRNLSPEDVEEIIERTAIDKGHDYSAPGFPLIRPGWDKFSGWGLANAHQALIKSKLPQYQIIHPNNLQTATYTVTKVDSNAFICFDKLYTTYGPLSQQVTLPIGQYYVDIYKITAQFNHQFYTASTTDTILGCWVRNSSSEGWGRFTSLIDTTAFPVDLIICNDFRTAPYTFLESYDENGATISTYYYHILTEYQSTMPVNQWYPMDTTSIQMEYSLYTYDSLRTTIFDYPCDSINPIDIPYLSIEKNNVFDFNLYPNPSDGSFTITANSYRSVNKINIRDITGKLIYSKTVTLNNSKLNMGFNLELPTGIYLIELQGNDFATSKKLIIQ